jgi:hypothetical protein
VAAADIYRIQVEAEIARLRERRSRKVVNLTKVQTTREKHFQGFAKAWSPEHKSRSLAWLAEDDEVITRITSEIGDLDQKIHARSEIIPRLNRY